MPRHLWRLLNEEAHMSIPIQTPPARRKVTLRLHAQLHETAQEAVRLGLAATQTAFIEDSIRMRAREVRHARMRRLADEAMGDPGFVADMRATVEEFRHADQECWPAHSARCHCSPAQPVCRWNQ
jgi:Ser/Thr protein kinase RdoA (MazF antagonist)